MDVKKTKMPEVIVKAIPDYKQFGRAAKLRPSSNVGYSLKILLKH